MNGDPTVVRGALIIVLTGAALGMAYNSIGLRSHPPHGIPWIAVKEELPSLVDSIAGAPMAEPPAPEVSTPAPQASGAPSHPTGSATTTHPTKNPGSSPPPATGSNGATGAQSPSTSPPPTSSAPAPEPRRPVPPPFVPESEQPSQVQLATVQRFFAAHAALFVDARDAAEYEAGHIPGAVRLTNPEANSDPERIKALPVQGRPIICYCEGGACEASLDLAHTLIGAGFKKVLVYMGGFPEWSSAGQPVEKGAAK